jgi:hypothetical protein
VKTLGVYVLMLCVYSSLIACQKNPMFHNRAQAEAFLQQHIGQQYYTAMYLRPFNLGNDYLIDLTGDISETVFELPRAAEQVALGSRITITGIEGLHVLAHIDGYAKPFRILLNTKGGTAEDVAEELQRLLSKTPPLQNARSEMRPFIMRQEVTPGMSRQEVYMSWGQPDKVNSSPGSSGYIEEWIYFSRPAHLYLRDGFVTNWQAY